MVRAELSLIKPRVELSETSIEVSGKVQLPVLDAHEETLLSILLKAPDLKKKVDSVEEGIFSDALLMCIKDEKSRSYEFAYLRMLDMWGDATKEQLDKELDKLISFFRRRSIVRTLENLEYEIKKAEKEGEKKRLAELVEEFAKASSRL